MATQKFGSDEIKGYTPALDIIDADTQFVIQGRNYVFDSNGPRSAFGCRLLEPRGFTNPKYMQGARLKISVGNKSLTITEDGIWEWNELLGGWTLLYIPVSTVVDEPYRWTSAYLDGKIYLCHPKPGILVYDLTTGRVTPHAKIANATPTNPLALCESNGRLCVITPDVFTWSGPSDGLDFAPALGGAGFQNINERVSGSPIMITSYANGCLTWTTGGVLRSEFTADATVFRHRSLRTDCRPVNSFCTVGIENDTTIVLDERGLYKTQGDTPEPYDPVMNEYLIGFIRDNALAADPKGNRLRLEWDDLARRLFLSICGSTIEGGYDTCLVYYTPLNKWGQFNEFHYGILPFDLNYGVRQGGYQGYCDSDGLLRMWTGSNSCEETPREGSHALLNLFAQTVQKDEQYDSTISKRILSTTIKVNTFDPSSINAQGHGRQAFYLPEASAPAPIVVRGLDSLIQIGVFRPTGPAASDEISEVLQVMLRSLDTQDPSVFNEDWQTLGGSDDFESESGSDDWGSGIPGVVGLKLRVIGTFDGTSEFMSQVPDLVEQVRGASYYACSVTGVWHILEVSAVDPGESYLIKGIEITATDAGRFL